MTHFRPVLIGVFSALAAAACSSSNLNDGIATTVGPSTNAPSGVAVVFPHPAGWADPQNHGPAALTAGPKLAPDRCNGCHDPNGETSQGDGAPGCRNCHAVYPHPDGWGDSPVHVRDLAASPDGLAAGISSKCATTCHGSDLAGGFSGVGCARCHGGYPHPADWRDSTGHGIAVISSATGGLPACRTCHGANLGGGAYGVSCLGCHALPDSSRPVQHKPSQTGACSSCHASLASDAKEPHLLLASAPSLCTPCHTQGRIAPAFRHSPLTSASSCLGCHVPHDGIEPGLLSARQADVCFSCHNKEITTAQYGTTRNMQAISTGSTNLHPPFRSGDCAGCHDAHGSAYNHLLTAPDPMFWTPNGVDARSFSCSACHNTNTYLLTATFPRPASVVRPVSSLPTQFVAFATSTSAAENLHAFHVVQAGAGCLACHDPHGDNDKYLLRSYLTYRDPGSSFWSYSACNGCHTGQIPADLNSLW
ncbi:MAG: cytochrome c3 family protein [Pseudomonadota bacterium]